MAPRLHPAVIIALVLSVICLANFFVLRSSVLKLTKRSASNDIVIRDSPGSLSADVFKVQRDTLSKILNEVKQELATMSCDMMDLKAKLNEKTSKVSVSGGWCKRTSFNNSGFHAFDRKFANALSLFFKDQRVVSLGDGPGDYKRFMDNSGLLKVYDAYDGAPFGPETSGGAVKFLDLTAPQYGLPVYDWVISLEVAEHIPAKYESIYVDNIVRHAGVGIVLSWARLGQGGTSHVNNKPLEYVQKLLYEKGFETDLEESKKLQQGAKLTWLRNNVYVYRRRSDSFALQDMA